MILQNNTVNIIDGDSFGVVTESKINDKKLSKLFGILSGLYKNIEESIVREYSSNAWDSHKSTNKEDTPIMIKLVDAGDDSSISFQDFGLGMPPETMNNIYFNYLDSTKENDDSVIGCFGLGSKSALAYTHTFFIDTIFDNILYHYMFSKQSNGIPAGELMYTEETIECNGTTIKIPIKKADVYTFHNALKAQLVYFPNVYVDEPYYFDNNFKIYDFDDFIYRPDGNISTLHMCVGNVYYPIDYSELKIDPIKLPFALKFNIGELMPTPSRENIVYSRESIKTINDKIAKVFQFLTDKINEKSIEVESISDYKPFYGEKDNVIEISDGLNITIPKLLLNNKSHFPDVKLPQIKGATKHMDSDMIYELRYFGWQYFHNEVRESGYQASESIGVLNSWDDKFIKHKNIDKHYLYLRYPLLMKETTRVYSLQDDELPNIFDKNQYLADTHYSKIRFIKKIKLSLKDFQKVFLNTIPKKEWRNTIDTLTKLVDDYIDFKYPYYNRVVVDEQWLADRKEKNRLATEQVKFVKDKGKVVFEYLEKDYSYGYVWKKAERTIDVIRSISKYIIHVPPTEKRMAKDLHSLLNSVKYKDLGDKWSTQKDNIFSVIAISKVHVKKFTDDKFISYDDFLTGKSNILKKLATAEIIKNLIGSVRDAFVSDTFKSINLDYYTLSMKLKNNYEKYLLNSRYATNDILRLITKNMVAIDNIDHYLIKDANRYKFIENKMSNVFNFIGKSYYNTWTYRDYLYIKSMMEQENLEVNRYFYYKPEFNPLINKQLNK
jgi:hypothetical protein